MPDLAEGQSTQVQGSGRTPYTLKNVGGVYSCSCPAWRNQSLPIDRRTCKHLRQYRGDQAEQSRLGSSLELREPAPAKQVPSLLLAQSWDNEQDLTGWWMSEKLDGVRAYWDGLFFVSRQGNRFHAPRWFTKGLPMGPLDGELWIGRQAFQRTVSIVRRQDAGDAWKQVKYVVFDAPTLDLPFEQRAVEIFRLVERAKYANGLAQVQCQGTDHLRMRLSTMVAAGGEGLMLRQPESRYEIGRSSTLLKVKQFQDAEARVIEHLPGAGRHRGRMGALLVELPNGKRFSVGTGFTDAQRNKPPALGSTITFRYQELTDGGIPRFPSFVREREAIL
jgi:DNA ligase 1